MNSTTFFLEALRKKGIDFLLFGLAIWYVVLENKEVRSEASACAEARLEYMRDENSHLKVLVERNTIALEKILEKL